MFWVAALLTGCAVSVGPTAAPQEPVASTQPFPMIEAEMHMATIWGIAVDAAGRYAVTASQDKTARVWDLATGKPQAVLRVPVGVGNEGRLYAVALSPDGGLVALGGWTGPTGLNEDIYLLDRVSGRMLGRISGLANPVTQLAFSPDGRHLAAALLGQNGIRIFSVSPPWAEVARDTDYQDSSHSVDFDRTGRLVATSWDGKVRLYDASFQRIGLPRELAGGRKPSFARFSPDGRRIAVGFDDSTAVSVVAGDDLRPMDVVDTRGVDNGTLSRVAWSADGQVLYAAGENRIAPRQYVVRAWGQQGRGPMQASRVATDSVMDLRSLPDGRLVFATGDPTWGILADRGQLPVQHAAPILDHRENFDWFRLSATGDVVEFPLGTWREGRWEAPLARFDVGARTLHRNVSQQVGLTAPRITGIPVRDWQNRENPTVDSRVLELQSGETARSLAISADAQRFALGTEWSVYLFRADGGRLWRTAVPDVAWRVNVTADGRFVVAALADGTVRWYRTHDGSEALALFVHADGERWVLWTPEGFFDAAPGAEALLGYHLNQGRDAVGEFVASEQLKRQFFRPDLIARRLAGDEATIAAAVKALGDVRQVLAAGLPPQLELLSAPEVTTDGDYELRVRIQERSGGVGRVEITINGAVVESRTAPTGGMLSQRVTLAPGRNVIAYRAYTRDNKVGSELVQAVVTTRPSGQRPKMHVVAVGVSHYEDGKLATEGIRFAARDAEAFGAKLRERGQGIYEDFDIVVLSKPEEVKLARIERALKELAQRYRPQDVAVIYLAGHGRAVDGKYHFLPGDLIFENNDSLREQSLTQAKLEKYLEALGVGKVLLVIDTCHAGAMAQTRGPDEPFAIANLMQMTGRAILAATLPDQLAVQDPIKGHGVYTGALLEGLDGAADLGRGYVNIDELANYVGRVVPDRAAAVIDGVATGPKQRPMRQTKGEAFDLVRTPPRR